MARTPVLRLVAPPETDPLEAWHQEKVFSTAELHKHLVPELDDLYAVPNGGFRHKATAAAMQRQGTKRGVPDMQLDVQRRGYAGLRIELKRFRNGSVEEEQKLRLARLAQNGYRAVVCWGWIAAWEELLWYLNREDLLLPSHHVTTRIIAAYPAAPYWQRKK